MKWIDILIYSERTSIRIFRHVLFWTTDTISYLVVISSNAEITAPAVYGILSRVPLVAALVYFILYFLIPKYSTKRNGGELFLWILGILTFVGVGIRYYRYYLMNPILDPTAPIPANFWDPGKILAEIFSWMGIISLAIAIKLIKARTELQGKNEELVREKRLAELSFLKAQMHPHFLFNTLNTLYSEAIKTDSKSEQLVLRLSGLLRFILEECNKPFVPLAKELKVIEDFVELEKLRHGSRLKVDWQADGQYPGAVISPLIFLPFVENSFKHTLASQPGMIEIGIRVYSDENFITLQVNNTRALSPNVHHDSLGMGVKNTRRQLELLYKDSFKLDIAETDQYRVTLKVPSMAAYE